MNEIIVKKDRTIVRAAGTGGVTAGILTELSAATAIPLALAANAIYAVALDDADEGQDAPLLQYPFFSGEQIRLQSDGSADIAVDDLLEPVDGGQVKTGAARPLFRALEAAPAAGGAGQLVACVQYIMDDLTA